MKKNHHVLFDNGTHKCLCFSDLVKGDGIQSNQFLIIDGESGALIDPGGELTFIPLTMAVSNHIHITGLKLIMASHQDPDIIASIGQWVQRTNAKVMVSSLWSRFMPHLSSTFAQTDMGANIYNNLISLDDAGDTFQLGKSTIKAIPAHFLHSVGNFQFYDATSKILFSGDMGASLGGGQAGTAVTDFKEHLPHMLGFHQRYIVSNKVGRLWANMVRTLDIDMIVPQHGMFFQGKESINAFIDWIADLQCGVDLMTQANYLVPR